MTRTATMSLDPDSAVTQRAMSRALFVRSGWLLAVLLVAAFLGHWAVPRLVHEGDAPTKLEAIIPATFGSWRVDPNIIPLTPSPDQVALLGEIYDQTLSRTYVNDRGERVMLSLAYGRNQSRRFQIHKPEICYVGQGFRLTEMRFGTVNLLDHAVPVMDLVAVQGARIEPITYWIRVGDELARGWVEQNLIRARFALRGRIPDGLLFRISTISRGQTEVDFELQRRFAQELMAAVPSAMRPDLIGDIQKLQPAVK